MYPNKNYESDIKYALELNRFFFRLLGIWPYAETSSPFIEGLRRGTLISICCFLLFSELISTVLHMFIIEKETRIRLKLVGPTIFTTMAIFKYCNLVCSREQIRNCLTRVNSDWQNVVSGDDRGLMTSKARDGRRVLILCSIFMYSSGFYFRTIAPLSRKKIVISQNITIRHLPCPAYFIFFNVHTSPAYEIVFFIQFFSGFVKYTITVAICSLAALFAMHICGQLEILITLMNNLVKEHKIKKTNMTLAMTVTHQIKTRNFLELVQEALQYTSLWEILGCTIIVCLMLYNIIMEWENQNVIAMGSYLILLTSITFNIFIFCFIGEQLAVEEEKLALTASTLPWYRLPDVTARSLVLIIIISNTPKKLKAGKFIDLSFKTFGDVVKAAVTYFNILRNFI